MILLYASLEPHTESVSPAKISNETVNFHCLKSCDLPRGEFHVRGASMESVTNTGGIGFLTKQHQDNV